MKVIWSDDSRTRIKYAKAPTPAHYPRARAENRAGPRGLRISRHHRRKYSVEAGCCRGTRTRPRWTGCNPVGTFCRTGKTQIHQGDPLRQTLESRSSQPVSPQNYAEDL